MLCSKRGDPIALLAFSLLCCIIFSLGLHVGLHRQAESASSSGSGPGAARWRDGGFDAPQYTRRRAFVSPPDVPGTLTVRPQDLLPAAPLPAAVADFAPLVSPAPVPRAELLAALGNEPGVGGMPLPIAPSRAVAKRDERGAAAAAVATGTAGSGALPPLTGALSAGASAAAPSGPAGGSAPSLG